MKYSQKVDNEELKYFLEEIEEDGFNQEEKEIIVKCTMKGDNPFRMYNMATLNCLYGTDEIMYNVPNKRFEIYDRYIGRIDYYVPYEVAHCSKSKKIYDFCKTIKKDLKENFFDIWFEQIDPSKEEWYHEAMRNPYSLEPTEYLKKTGVTVKGYEKIKKAIENCLPSIDLMGDNPFGSITIIDAIRESLFKKYNLYATNKLLDQLFWYDNM